MQRKKILCPRRLICGILSAGLLFSSPGLICASAETAVVSGGEAPSDPTPTPDPHTSSYYQDADTDALKGWPQAPHIEAEAAVVMDLTTNTILYSKNADRKMYPASITKVMTDLLACEHLDMNGEFVMSQTAAYGIEPGSSSIYGDTGEEFTIEQALMGLMLESANEMALALAEQTSGSVKKFVELMNERARSLGCTGTHFNNPNGLPDETHYTTANDMAKIARAAWLNPYSRKFMTTDYYEIPPTNIMPETRYMLNHHKMMAGRERAYEGVLGGKTGYTEVAGNTLVTYAKKGGMSLVCVVMQSVDGAYSDTAALLDYGFNSFSNVKLKVPMQSYPLKVLPSEKYILKDEGNVFAFYYPRKSYVTVPSGTDTDKLEEKKEFLPAGVMPGRIRHSYYFNGYLVGQCDEFEKNIFTNLLI